MICTLHTPPTLAVLMNMSIGEEIISATHSQHHVFLRNRSRADGL
jgi:hypothetical protein